MRYKSFFTKSACGLLVCKNDKYSTIIEANDAFYKMVGYTREEMYNLYKDRFAELVMDDLTGILKKVGDAVDNKWILDYEYRVRHKSGKVIWIHDVAVYDEENDIFNVVIMDISYKEKLLERVSYEASIDKVTGLLNRTTLEKRIKKEQLSKKPQTMFLIDLDNFKMVNDTVGHQIGDELLSYIGNILGEIFKSNGIVGRLGGDEFMAFLTDIDCTDILLNISKDITNKINVKIQDVEVSVSVGVVFDKSGNCNFKDLYRYADEMLYRAKGKNKGRYEFEVIL